MELSLPAVKGYCMLSSVLQHANLSITHGLDLEEVFQPFEMEAPKSSYHCLGRNLDVVLKFLMLPQLSLWIKLPLRTQL